MDSPTPSANALMHTPSNATDAPTYASSSLVEDGGTTAPTASSSAAATAAPVETSTAVANAPLPPTMTPPRTTPPTPSPRRSWQRWREKEQVQNLCYGMSNLEGTYLQRVLVRGVPMISMHKIT